MASRNVLTQLCTVYIPNNLFNQYTLNINYEICKAFVSVLQYIMQVCTCISFIMSKIESKNIRAKLYKTVYNLQSNRMFSCMLLCNITPQHWNVDCQISLNNFKMPSEDSSADLTKGLSFFSSKYKFIFKIFLLVRRKYFLLCEWYII